MSRCHVWTGARNSDHYGVVRIRGRLELAHRMAYRLHVGPIPRGRELHHECGNRACINPAHLRPVTHRENCRASSSGRVRDELASSSRRDRARKRCAA